MRVLYTLCLLFTAVQGLVQPVTSLDQFYDIVNEYNPTAPRYTIVKYYTNWCSHCKKLKPIFEQLSESDELGGPELIHSSVISHLNFTFFEVDCEIFGNMLCKRLDGFPAIEIIKPLKAPLDLTAVEDPRGWIDRLLDAITHAGYDLKWTLDVDRVEAFRGRRELQVLISAINRIVDVDQWGTLLNNIMQDSCLEGDQYCQSGRVLFKELKDATDIDEKLVQVEEAVAKVDSPSKELLLEYQVLNLISELNQKASIEQEDSDNGLHQDEL